MSALLILVTKQGYWISFEKKKTSVPSLILGKNIRASQSQFPENWYLYN